MGFIKGEARGRNRRFQYVPEELIPEDHSCPVIEAYVGTLNMQGPQGGTR
jgi:hypothetical protein